MAMNFPILSTGAALPRTCVSNDDLVARGVETNDAWIVSRTGIRQRYICEKDESTFTLARDAAVQALERAGIAAADVGVIVVATCTPDLSFPSVAALVQGAIGAPTTCAALDVNGACSGFIMALATAKGLLAQGMGKHALVIGAETFSRVVDWNDRGTCVLFGDGAGAVVMGCTDDGVKGLTGDAAPQGLLAVELGMDGTQAGCLKSSGGVSSTQTAGVVVMQGREVFKQAVRQMGQVPPVLAQAGLALGDVDWLVPHQANVRILEAARDALGVAADKLVVTVDKHANTSAASIPLALDAAVTDGRIARGDIVLMQAFGAGLSWGSAVVRW
ncbi:MAG: ketoacyl-ACP synthase III [Pseudomonadaceae bacterium]|nr:ketoacyl-ACP synthase III [Pseudomonadaceae bacterium]